MQQQAHGSKPSFGPRERPDLAPKIHDLPHKPGVYLMRDRLNRVIYVGKARDLRKRVSQYFLASRKSTADLKTRALLDSIWDFEVHLVKSEPEALLLEGRLIKDFRPRYNVSFRDDKRFLLVKVDEREDWPRFRLARIKKDDGARYFGPYAYAGALRQTLNFMRRKFGVLTFGRGAPVERELKYSCYQVPSRLGDINAEQYKERVAQACEFLSGASSELIDLVEGEMRQAAEKLNFERAAELRNMLDDLRQTTKPMRRFTRHSLPTTIDPVADLSTLADALQLPHLPKAIECFDISNISTTHVVASMVSFKDGVADKSNYRRYRIRTVEGQDDFASMAEVVRRRYSRVLLTIAETAKPTPSTEEDSVLDLSGEFSQENALETARRLERQSSPLSALPAPLSNLTSPVSGLRSPVSARPPVFIRLPDLIIVDGGKGQLSSACKELQRLGLHEIPIIGLAKENEEIYRPGRPLPLTLPEDSGALRLLQRVRDEAHRFANSYHQLLMKKRIAESLLDDCPGVSEHRKQLLLRRFGSVDRIRRATVEEIAATEGIGQKLAEQVVQFLREKQA